ncbi:MAG TPA: aldo/keto reductase [Planctomycetota bacterium]|nr:aldo/keto reductase [Planctomycetota bacterium]
MATLSRREILAAGAAVLAASRLRARPSLEPLPERPLGRTGRSVPLLGLGCFPLGNLRSDQDAQSVVARAFETGARYFDTAPSYGGSERRLGKAIADFPREKLFLATKTLERDGDGALADLERSLERLGTDYVDSVQVHELRSFSDVEGLFRKGGVVAALEDARRRKKLRFVGITGHRDPAVLLAAIERLAFDTALVPVNPLDRLHRSFARDFVPKAREKGIGVIAMKVYAGGAIPSQKAEVPIGDLIRFALAEEGVCVAVPGADSPARWDEARAGATLPPLDPAAKEALVARCGPHRGKASEWYKEV